MDSIANYNGCPQYNPSGWATARMAAPCCPRGRRTDCCRPAYQPQVPLSNSGMNEAKDESVKNDPDPCHGRRFCPPLNQVPISVKVTMCPAPDSTDNTDTSTADYMNYSRNISGRAFKGDPFCPSSCPLPRCKPGVKVERTLPIIPLRTFMESNFKMNNASVYKSDYVGRNVTLTKSFAPENIPIDSTGSFEKDSLTRLDYVPYKVCPYKKPPWAFAKARQESNVKMSGISSYKIDYLPKDVKPAPSAKPVKFISANPGSDNSRTIYQVDYIEHPLPEKEYKLKTDAQLRNCVPFDGLTIYRRDFIKKMSKPAMSVLDKTRASVKDRPPMDKLSTYRASFEPFHFDDTECIPAEIYDRMYPPKDKCTDVTCYPEAERCLEDPIQPPSPPCPSSTDKSYCPSPYEMRCCPKTMPCVPSYVLKKEVNPYDDATVIRVEHNLSQSGKYQPVEYICPKQPCNDLN